jgi:hypothetical protein
VLPPIGSIVKEPESRSEAIAPIPQNLACTVFSHSWHYVFDGFGLKISIIKSNTVPKCFSENFFLFFQKKAPFTTEGGHPKNRFKYILWFCIGQHTLARKQFLLIF